MRTAVADTSIDALHAHRASGKLGDQHCRILAHIREHGGDWSIGELARALGMEKSTVSARVNELLTETFEVVAAPRRKDRVSGVTVLPVKLAPEQLEMLA